MAGRKRGDVGRGQGARRIWKSGPVPCDKTVMQDQIIDAAMALALQTDANRARPVAGWIVMRDPPEHPGRFAARLVTDHATPYVLVVNSLADLQAQMPAGLVRTEYRFATVPDMVEAWFVA